MPDLLRSIRALQRIVLCCIALTLVGCPDNPGDGGVEGEGEGEGEAVATMEMDAFTLINGERTGADVAPLVMDGGLRAVARAHSEDMLARDFFAHDNPDGESPFDRIHAAGIEYARAGENIAWNNFPNPVETAVDGWMNSEGHRNNILNGEFTLTGMGVAGDAANGYYFTQVFTRPLGKAGEAASDVLLLERYLPPPLALTP